MKKLLLLLLTIVSLQAKSQFISLPDSNLRNILIPIYPTIFNSAKQMDTVKARALTTGSTGLSLTFKNISNLTGIEYINRINRLDISNNPITTLNKLPPSCTTLIIRNCGIISLPTAVLTPSNLQELDISNFSSNTLNSPISNFNALPVNITSLNISKCNYTSFPSLPQFIKTLNINDNAITMVSTLPDSLTIFNCRNNLITNLPVLPSKLTSLNCSNNKISSLPVLPSKLTSLICSNNNISSLPNLPSDLLTLDCNFNKISGAFPPLPPSIITLTCFDNQISSIPTLPNTLKDINFSNNLISSIPNIPISFQNLYFNSNLLTSFPNIPRPNNFYYNRIVWFGNNNISILPVIPNSDSVTYNLNISYNPISNINDVFSLKLYDLNVSGLPISSLPDTINTESHFSCNNNKLRKLPYIKSTGFLSFAFSSFDTINLEHISDDTYSLDLSYSNISKFPKRGLVLVLYGRPDITCIPRITNGIFLCVDTTVIKCLPNYFYNPFGGIDNSVTNTFGTDSLAYIKFLKDGGYGSRPFPIKITILPICSPTNNINNCASFPNIIGTVYVDENNNNTKDPNEPFRANVPVRLKANNKTVTNINGAYSLMADSIGGQTLTVTAPPFYTAVPSTVNLNFGRYDTLVNVPPIALQKTISKDSLAVKITPINWAARPGFAYPFFVQYENVGSNTVNANINISFNSNALNYDSSSTTVNATTGNIQLLKNSFTPGSQGGFISYFKVKPNATLLGTNLKTWATIAGGATTAADTTNRIIGGSYDPNDKLSTPRLSTTQVAEGEFINYTVRFQNTGTDTAFTVVIADTLSSLLQTNTFEMLSSSHTCKTIIQDNKIYFEFRNILLPDSTTNLIGSNGFVNFRIKPISSVVLNSIIPNKAAIYFDYNEPIITNTATTTISNIVLPNKLISFNAALQTNKNVLLFWTTANEVNMKEYIVEESADGVNFKTLAIEQARNQNNNSYYNSKVLQNQKGNYYFRLKMLGNDGAITYSNIIKINLDGSTHALQVVTNPVKDKLYINVISSKLQNTQAQLVNNSGKLVKTIILKLGNQAIDIASLSSGVYYLKTIEGVEKIVISQ